MRNRPLRNPLFKDAGGRRLLADRFELLSGAPHQQRDGSAGGERGAYQQQSALELSS